MRPNWSICFVFVRRSFCQPELFDHTCFLKCEESFHTGKQCSSSITNILYIVYLDFQLWHMKCIGGSYDSWVYCTVLYSGCYSYHTLHILQFFLITLKNTQFALTLNHTPSVFPMICLPLSLKMASCGYIMRIYNVHSLIISREVLILTLSIFNAQ